MTAQRSTPAVQRKLLSVSRVIVVRIEVEEKFPLNPPQENAGMAWQDDGSFDDSFEAERPCPQHLE